jgi:D-glycero-alpha-D-manno-heptose-7-phosphate kinase
VLVERIPVDLDALSSRLRLVYTGAPHDSGFTNWGSMRAWFDGDATARACLTEIADRAREVRASLRAGDLDAALLQVVEEGRARRRMAPGVTTPAIEALDAAVRAAGAVGTKPCGAGGGGTVLVVLADDRPGPALEEALRTRGGRPLRCRLTMDGITFEEPTR